MQISCWDRSREAGGKLTGSNFFKGKGKDVTQSSPSFIKQAHVWTHLIPLEVEGKGCEDHIESDYNAEDALIVIATKRTYSAKSMPRDNKTRHKEELYEKPERRT